MTTCCDYAARMRRSDCVVCAFRFAATAGARGRFCGRARACYCCVRVATCCGRQKRTYAIFFRCFVTCVCKRLTHHHTEQQHIEAAAAGRRRQYLRDDRRHCAGADVRCAGRNSIQRPIARRSRGRRAGDLERALGRQVRALRGIGSRHRRDGDVKLVTII